MHLIDVRAAWLSDYSYPITKSSNWTAVIGHPRDQSRGEPITIEHFVTDTITPRIVLHSVQLPLPILLKTDQAYIQTSCIAKRKTK